MSSRCRCRCRPASSRTATRTSSTWRASWTTTPYAVVLVDGQEARILIVAMQEVEEAARTEAAEEIRRFQAGGWAQMIFQRRTDNIIKAHHKDLAEQLGRAIKRYSINHIIIAGNDSIKGSIMQALPEQIKSKLVDYIHMDLTAALPEILAIVEPMMQQVERQQEADDLAALEAQVNSNDLGVVGVAETAMALTKGQVRTLLITPTFQSVGGECPSCGTIRAGLRPKCPYDGAEMQPLDLREAFTLRTLQQSANVQVVESSEFLDQHEGVGAILRYRDDAQSRTA